LKPVGFPGLRLRLDGEKKKNRILHPTADSGDLVMTRPRPAPRRMRWRLRVVRRARVRRRRTARRGSAPRGALSWAP
jgi:hypothetical protein